MATLKSEFQELAAELIDDEFADFKRPFIIKKNGDYSPVTGETPPFNAETGAIPLDLKTAEKVFTNVTSSEIYLVILNAAPVPSGFDESYHCSYNGVDYDINQVEGDPADAAYFIRIVI
jgi:hypothetical protein